VAVSTGTTQNYQNADVAVKPDHSPILTRQKACDLNIIIIVVMPTLILFHIITILLW